MKYDAKTSEEVMVFLRFALDCCTEPEHLKQFHERNADVIASLTDEDKETLRGVYRETVAKLRKAA